jgi:hypothetical protein
MADPSKSRYYLVRLRAKRPVLGWTLTVIATVAAFVVSIALIPFLGSLAGIGIIVLSLFLVCLWLGVKLGYVKWNE